MPSYLLSYLDPGSGSVLLYVLISIAVSIGFSLKRTGYHLLRLLSIRVGSKGFDGDLRARILLHCEGPQYEALFIPLILELHKCQADFLFITQYHRDESFRSLPESVRHVSVNDSHSGFAALNKARGDLFVTTTPQLDVLALKRSPSVQRYVNILHAPSDLGRLELYALDFFDAVLCPGSFVFEDVRVLEQLRRLPEKTLYNTGVLYYDTMIQEVRSRPLPGNQERPVVLVAPSWGPKSLIANTGVGFLHTLAKEYQLIVRLHPQTHKSQPQLYEEIRSCCDAIGAVFDECPNATESMNASDIMVSDFSGVSYDYAFLHEKPAIVFNMESDDRGYEGYFLPKPTWRNRVLPEVADVLSVKEIERLPSLLKSVLDSDPKPIAAVRDRDIAHFGKAAPVAVQQLLEILEEVAKEEAAESRKGTL